MFGGAFRSDSQKFLGKGFLRKSPWRREVLEACKPSLILKYLFLMIIKQNLPLVYILGNFTVLFCLILKANPGPKLLSIRKSSKMQLFADEPKHYIVLIFPLAVFLFGNNSIIHVMVLSVYCLLFASGTNCFDKGTYFKNYCNMVVMIVLFPMLIFQNLHYIV